MATFNNREKAFEDKFKHDAELQFRVEARRNKLLGLWASEMIGVEPDQVQDYVKSVIEADFEEAGTEDVFRKIFKDFQDNNVDVSEHRLRKKIEEFYEIAKTQIMNE